MGVVASCLEISHYIAYFCSLDVPGLKRILCTLPVFNVINLQFRASKPCSFDSITILISICLQEDSKRIFEKMSSLHLHDKKTISSQISFSLSVTLKRNCNPLGELERKYGISTRVQIGKIALSKKILISPTFFVLTTGIHFLSESKNTLSDGENSITFCSPHMPFRNQEEKAPAG